MKNELEKLQKQAAAIRLTTDERRDMKNDFSAFLDLNEIPKHVPESVVRRRLTFRYLSAAPVFAVLVLMFLSEPALPHEPLYKVKTGVTENILLTSAAVSKYTQARADMLMVERRLGETVDLAKESQLTPEVAALLEDEITGHAEALDAYIEAEVRSGDYEEAIEMNLSLENILEGHSHVLRILTETNVATSTIEPPLHEDIDSRGRAVSQRGDELVEDFIGSNTPETETYIDELAETVTESLLELDAEIQEHENQVPEEFAEHAKDLREGVDDLLASSTAHQGEEYESAILLHEALESIEQATIILSSGEEYEGDSEISE